MSEDVFWSKVAKSQPANDNDDDDDYEQAPRQSKTKQAQKAFSYIDDGTEDPFDQLSKLERVQQRKEKAKGNKNLVGAPIKGAKFKPTVSKNDAREDAAQQERASARDRRLEREAIKTLNFAVPFQEDKKKQKKKVEIVESADKELASITVQQIESAIASAELAYKSSPIFQVKSVLGELESNRKSRWEQSQKKEEPLQFLNKEARARLEKWVSSFDDALASETATFVLETVYSQQGVERDAGKLVVLRAFLQLVAKTKPSAFLTVLQKHVNSFATNAASFTNLIWIVQQVPITVQVAGALTAVLVRTYAVKYSKFQPTFGDTVNGLLKVLHDTMKKMDVSNAIGIEATKSLLVLEAEDASEKSSIHDLFQLTKNSIRSSAALEPLLENVSQEKTQEQTLYLIYSLFSNSNEAMTEWRTLFAKHIENSLQLFEYLDNFDGMPQALRKSFVDTLKQVQQSIMKQAKDKKLASQASKRLQAYLEATPAMADASSGGTSWFGIFVTLALFAALVIGVIFVAPEYCRKNIANPIACDALDSWRSKLKQVFDMVMAQVKKQ